MSNTSLTATDLFNLVKNTVNLVKTSTHHRIELRDENKITKEQNELISDYETRLLNVANRNANAAIDKTITTDLGDAKEVLNKTTDDLDSVISELNDFNNFIGTLGNVINIFTRISQAIAGGVPAIIRSLVEELVKLTDSGSGSRDVLDSPGDDTSFSLGNINET